jgi:hypothetical protein
MRQFLNVSSAKYIAPCFVVAFLLVKKLYAYQLPSSAMRLFLIPQPVLQAVTFVILATPIFALYTRQNTTTLSQNITTLSINANSNKCTNPVVRREWSSVSQAQRDSYISAVMCLTKKPSIIGLKTSRFDDYTWVHRQMFGDSQLIWVLTKAVIN